MLRQWFRIDNRYNRPRSSPGKQSLTALLFNKTCTKYKHHCIQQKVKVQIKVIRITPSTVNVHKKWGNLLVHTGGIDGMWKFQKVQYQPLGAHVKMVL